MMDAAQPCADWFRYDRGDVWGWHGNAQGTFLKGAFLKGKFVGIVLHKIYNIIIMGIIDYTMGLEIENDTAVITRTEEKLDTPDMHRVIMHNDNYTTMEFVISVLVTIFKKKTAEAMELMLKIHKQDQAMIGVYTYDVAYTRVKQVHKLAEQFEFPLKCSIIDDNG